MNKYAASLKTISTAVTKAQNVGIFATEFQQKWAVNKIRITISVTAAIKVLLYSDGNGEAVYLNAGAALVADTIYTFEHTLDTSRSWNVQTDDLAGITAEILTITEVAE